MGCMLGLSTAVGGRFYRLDGCHPIGITGLQVEIERLVDPRSGGRIDKAEINASDITPVYAMIRKRSFDGSKIIGTIMIYKRHADRRTDRRTDRKTGSRRVAAIDKSTSH